MLSVIYPVCKDSSQYHVPVLSEWNLLCARDTDSISLIYSLISDPQYIIGLHIFTVNNSNQIELNIIKSHLAATSWAANMAAYGEASSRSAFTFIPPVIRTMVSLEFKSEGI